MFQVTDLQLDVLRELWRRGEGSVADVHAALKQERGLATTTVATEASTRKAVLYRMLTQSSRIVWRARFIGLGAPGGAGTGPPAPSARGSGPPEQT